MIDPQVLRSDFPLLTDHADLAYLDNAATSQKPASVLEAMDDFYRTRYGSVRRGVHHLSESATADYEGARQKVASFINAESEREIIFTRGTTSAINLVARTLGAEVVRQGKTIVTTEMEHHSNFLPWLSVAEGAKESVRFIQLTDQGELDLDDAKQKLRGAGFLAVTHTSNVLGTINPIQQLVEIAHDSGALVIVDAAQAVAQCPLNVQALGADLVAFSGHKMLGPTGIGVLWGKAEILQQMPPLEWGGQMVGEFNGHMAEPAEYPWKFEAGTMPVAEAVGLSAAIEYLSKLGMSNVAAHEQTLSEYALKQLSELSEVTIYGPTDPAKRGGLVSFTVAGVHAHDLATILDDLGVAIRSGHHCAAPLREQLGVPATARASWSVYNTTDDIDRLIGGIKEAQKTFAS